MTTTIGRVEQRADIGQGAEMKIPASLVPTLGLAMLLSACAATSSQVTRPNPPFVEDDPYRSVKVEGRAKGYEFAVAMQCGGDPKRVQTVRDRAGFNMGDAMSVAAFRDALAENYARAMREEHITPTQCDTARRSASMAELYPAPLDPAKMNRRDRAAYFAQMKAKQEEQEREDAKKAAILVEAARQGDEMRATQAAQAQALAQCDYESSLATTGMRPYRRGLAAAILSDLDQAITKQDLMNRCRRARGVN